MIKVVREQIPYSLRNNASLWSTELAHQIQICDSYKDVPTKYKTRYNKPDVQGTLARMYNGKCCYCESPIGETEYECIEHRMPKSVFHQHTYDWTKLHWACPRCNTNKTDKWDTNYPILDATLDDPDAYFKYDVITCEAQPLSSDW